MKSIKVTSKEGIKILNSLRDNKVNSQKELQSKKDLYFPKINNMKFKEKFDQLVAEVIKEDPEEYMDDNGEVSLYDVVPYLEDKVLGWPMIAVQEPECDLDVETIDTENIEIDVFDDHVHVFAGGDWQLPADFDIVLNDNPLTSEQYPFVACNIMCRNKFNGEEITSEDL